MRYIVRIRCQDASGLIYKVTKILYEKGFNILNNAEHVEEKLNEFFMRTEIEGGSINSTELEEALKNELPHKSEVQIIGPRKKDLVILVTKEAHCVGDLLIRCVYEGMEANIRAVIGNHDTLRPLVEKFEIPFHFVSHEGVSREAHERKVKTLLMEYTPDYIVLAKYMRVLTPDFLNEFQNRIVNIHHSFLPAFIGANPYKQAHERGVKILGATAHFVNEELDEGPIIAQGVIPITHSDDVSDMVRAGRDVEKITLARAIKLLIEDRLFVYENKTVIFD